MTATAYGEQRPPLVPVARRAHLMLEITQMFNMLPEPAVFRLYAIKEERLLVAVGGLNNQFLLGPRATDADLIQRSGIEPVHHTAAALRVWREVADTVDHAVPRTSTGSHWFEVGVWLQTEHWWRMCEATAQPEGVIVASDGELRW